MELILRHIFYLWGQAFKAPYRHFPIRSTLFCFESNWFLLAFYLLCLHFKCLKYWLHIIIWLSLYLEKHIILLFCKSENRSSTFVSLWNKCVVKKGSPSGFNRVSALIRRTVYQNWPFWVKTPITSTVLICTLYKLQGSFIILLGVYC